MAAMFVSQNNETAAMFVSQTSPVRVEPFSYVNAFFCSKNLHRYWPREWKHRIQKTNTYEQIEPDKIILSEKGEKDFKSPYRINFWHIF